MFGGAILIVLYVMALFAGFFAPYSYSDRIANDSFIRPPGRELEGFHLVVPRYEQKPGQFIYRTVRGRHKADSFFRAR